MASSTFHPTYPSRRRERDIRNSLHALAQRNVVFALEAERVDVVLDIHRVLALLGAERTRQRLFEVGVDARVRRANR